MVVHFCHETTSHRGIPLKRTSLAAAAAAALVAAGTTAVVVGMRGRMAPHPPHGTNLWPKSRRVVGSPLEPTSVTLGRRASRSNQIRLSPSTCTATCYDRRPSGPAGDQCGAGGLADHSQYGRFWLYARGGPSLYDGCCTYRAGAGIGGGRVPFDHGRHGQRLWRIRQRWHRRLLLSVGKTDEQRRPPLGHRVRWSSHGAGGPGRRCWHRWRGWHWWWVWRRRCGSLGLRGQGDRGRRRWRGGHWRWVRRCWRFTVGLGRVGEGDRRFGGKAEAVARGWSDLLRRLPGLDGVADPECGFRTRRRRGSRWRLPGSRGQRHGRSGRIPTALGGAATAGAIGPGEDGVRGTDRLRGRYRMPEP